MYRQHAECNIDPENTLSQYKSFVWIVNIGSTKQITPDQTSSIIHFDSRSFTQIQDCLLWYNINVFIVDISETWLNDKQNSMVNERLWPLHDKQMVNSLYLYRIE